MADDSSSKSGMDDLVNLITGSIKGVGDVSAALQRQNQDVVTASTTQLTDLMKNNAFNPDMTADAPKVHKAVTDATIAAISGLSDKTKSTTGGDS
ncbi:hypothetical protein ACFL12_05505 [Pseudomonadota bacterium]